MRQFGKNRGTTENQSPDGEPVSAFETSLSFKNKDHESETPKEKNIQPIRKNESAKQTRQTAAHPSHNFLTALGNDATQPTTCPAALGRSLIRNLAAVCF